MLTHVALRQRCWDKLWVKAISSNALDPRLSCDIRDYQSLWMLDFCERNVGRRAQPAVMKINGFIILAILSRFFPLSNSKNTHRCKHKEQ